MTELNERLADPPGGADIAIINAHIFTADDACPECRALAICGDRITATGDNSDILPLIGENTRIIDAQGCAAAPGMVDAHLHLLSATRGQFYNICLTVEMSRDDYLVAIAEHIAANPDREIYTGSGFMPEKYPDKFPDRHTLDAICSEKPVILLSYDGHTTWVNSAALKLRGIDRNTPDPENGVIHRDAVGEPTGYLAGAAGACEGGMMRQFMPTYTLEQNKFALERAQEIMLRQGVTSIYDAHVNLDPEYYMAYEELAREGRLMLTVRGAWFIARDMGDEAAIMDYIDRCIACSAQFRTDNFRVNGFKFLCDQVCEAETAYLCEPYCDRSDGWCGLRIWEDGDMLARIFAKIDGAGFQIHLHQIGDGAAKYALDALEKAAQLNGGLKMQHTFAHCQIISEADKRRMALLGVSGLVAPYWINTTIFDTFDVPHLGHSRACRQYPVGSLMRCGVNTACHSDYSVSMPDWCDALYGLTVRTLSPRAFDVFYDRLSGVGYTLDPALKPSPTLLAPLPGHDERISLHDAIKVITANGARSMYAHELVGALRPGMRADIVVFDHDLKVPDSPKCSLSVRATVCGGRVMYETC